MAITLLEYAKLHYPIGTKYYNVDDTRADGKLIEDNLKEVKGTFTSSLKRNKDGILTVYITDGYGGGVYYDGKWAFIKYKKLKIKLNFKLNFKTKF